MLWTCSGASPERPGSHWTAPGHPPISTLPSSSTAAALVRKEREREAARRDRAFRMDDQKALDLAARLYYFSDFTAIGGGGGAGVVGDGAGVDEEALAEEVSCVL